LVQTRRGPSVFGFLGFVHISRLTLSARYSRLGLACVEVSLIVLAP
jgi:hypothetical protein